jgi:hypothetical protein
VNQVFASKSQTSSEVDGIHALRADWVSVASWVGRWVEQLSKRYCFEASMLRL